MNKVTKKVLSISLSLLMTSSTILGSYAENINIESNSIQSEVSNNKSYFDFGASEYEIEEDKNQFDIKVLRHGNLSGDVDVSFKIADFIATYGVDYTVLDENNKPLEKIEGEKPNLSDFTFDEEKNETDPKLEGELNTKEKKDVNKDLENKEKKDEDKSQKPELNQEKSKDKKEENKEDEKTTQEQEKVQEDKKPDLNPQENVNDNKEGNKVEEQSGQDLPITPVNSAVDELKISKYEDKLENTELPKEDIEKPKDENSSSSDVNESTQDSLKEESKDNSKEEIKKEEENKKEEEENKKDTQDDKLKKEKENKTPDLDGEKSKKEDKNLPKSQDEKGEKKEDKKDELNKKETKEKKIVENQKKISDVESVKQNKSSGSPLLDAYKSYLNIPELSSVNKDETESVIGETLNDMYKYFLSAQGAKGVLHFKDGQREKTIRIKVNDNKISSSDKLFMIALMGTNSDDAMIAANATTYVTIKDNEEYINPSFEIVEDEIRLSKELPQAYVTIRRTSGEQYFSKVSLSTIKQTALDIAYDNFENKEIGFAPGETEKKVKITAYDFSEKSEFGLKLEEEGANIGKDYITVFIDAKEKNEEELEEIVPVKGSNQDSVILGQPKTSFELNNFPGGWNSDIKQSGGSHYDQAKWINGKYLYLSAYTKGVGVSWITNKTMNFTGIKNVDFKFSIGTDGRGTNFTTWFEIDKYRQFFGVGKSFAKNGITLGWSDFSLDTSGANGEYYMKFKTRPLYAGRHNPVATLGGPLVYNWAKYSFIPQNSLETFRRNIYDFSEGTPKIYPTYFDGENDIDYNPGGVEIKSSDKNLEGFYANNEATITISAKEKDKNEKNGIYLKGVYFTLSNRSDQDLYSKSTKKYNTKNTYYLASNPSNHEIKLNPNQDFIKMLLDSGAISSDAKGDISIKVYPVFAQHILSVNFENTDRDDSKAETRGKFDENNKNSYLVNILEAHKQGYLKKYVHQGWLDFYNARFPKNSVIRVKAVAKNNRTISGIKYWFWEGNQDSKVEYYKAGQKKFSSLEAQKETIKETDYSKADIILTGNMSMAPLTGKQSFYIGYSPRTYSYLPNNIKNLKGSVINSTIDGEQETTNEAGYLYIKEPHIGKTYTLSVLSPEGYYTSWINMTGDKNNDGIVDFEEGANSSARNTQNPIELYGNKLTVKLDQDDTRYYYEFRKKAGDAGLRKNGTVLREKNSFYNIVKGIPSREKEAIVGAWMDIAGFRGQTDGKGNYSIDLNGLPPWGQAGVSLNIGGKEYNQTVRLERELETNLPAFETFKAKSISATYNRKPGSVTENYITIENDELELDLKVESLSVLRPEKVRFFIHDENGYEVVKTEEKPDAYKVETIGPIGVNNEYRVKLRFNPKVNMKLGYKVYVQFGDQNSTWYPKIDTGYEFFKELDLKEFTFPLLGSSTVENLYKSGFVTDIIGDPLGDLSLGSISGFETSGEKYVPQGIPEEHMLDNSWYKHSYKFGWSTSIGRAKNWGNSNNTQNKNENDSSDDKQDDKVEKEQKEILSKVKSGEISGKPTEQSKFATKGSFSWRVSPSVGFKLTLSTRKDGKQYFEDLAFYIKAGFNVRSMNVITLPIGLNIIIGANLSGDVTGIYYMYTDYEGDPYQRKTVPYTTKDFGVFKQSNNNIRREGYLFINPKIGISLGAGYGIVSVSGVANFDFDMDFKFKDKETKAYGDVKIDLGWKISLVGFDVYSKKITQTTERLFNTSGQNGHIDFDFNNIKASAYSTAMNYLKIDEDSTLVLDRPVAGNYHFTQGSKWNGKKIAASIADSKETVEVPVLDNAGDDLQVKLAKLSDNRMIMVYIGYDPSRNNVNKRALYYSIGQGDSWSEPQLIDNDKTLDDYPDIQDLGDKLLISWSSAGKEFEEGSGLEDVLKSLNIKTRFVDKNTGNLEEVTQLTKTTDQDFTSDVFPRAAYDKDSKKLILYYTKTEYNGVKTFKDIITASSVNAYIMYDENNGGWQNNGSVYTDEELARYETPEAKQAFRDNWYGQRFLDLRTDLSNTDFVRVAETAAISYNNLGLFAWTVDNDKNLNTNNDRDVFMQIYDFKTNKFTHIIRVTQNSGVYSTPKFARSNNSTYLFFGSKDDKSEYGKINYLDISDIISKSKYEKSVNNLYYELKENIKSQIISLPDGASYTIPSEMAFIQPEMATQSNNINDYDVHVTEDGKLYLLWSDTVMQDGKVSRQIMASMYGASLDKDDEKIAMWSDPFVITNANAGEYYRGIGVSVVGDDIYIGAEKGSYDRQNYNSSQDTVSSEGRITENGVKPSSLIVAKHKPSSKLQVVGLTIDEEGLNKESNKVRLIAMVKNDGLLPREGGDTINFTVNGSTAKSVKFMVSNSQEGNEVKDFLPGSKIVEVSADIELSEGFEDEVTFGANINNGETLEIVKDFNAKDKINLVSDEIIHTGETEYSPEQYVYKATIENKAKNTTGDLNFEIFAGDVKIAQKTLNSLESGEMQEVEIPFDLKDSLYDINDGVGKVDINIVANSANEDFINEEKTVNKQFDSEYIALLEKAKLNNNIKYNMNLGETKDIQPDIEGVKKGELIVHWLNSSNNDIASINSANHIIANKKGSVQLEGIVVPNKEKIDIDALGQSNIKDWRTLAPSDKIIYVKADLNVDEASSDSGSSSGSGSGSSSKDNDRSDSKNTSQNKIKETIKEKVSDKNDNKMEDVSEFKDVSPNNWFYEGVKYVVEKGLFKGTSKDEFSPNKKLTRAMLATVLYRAEKMPKVNKKSGFKDVKENAYYSDAVSWAKENKIVYGKTDKDFKPNDNITRQEMAVIIFRYAKLKGKVSSFKGKANLDYKDKNNISVWAIEGIEFCKQNNIMVGNEKKEFKAENNSTRAETAVSLQKLFENVIDKNNVE